MKHYDVGDCGVGFIFSLEGSVIIKTMAWALPSSLVAVAISFFLHGDKRDPMIEISETKDYKDMAQLWVGFSFMIGFLITFRTGKAYGRWWEGATLLQQARGEWVNCFSNCIAFCSDKADKQIEVQNFREYLALLMSLLFSAALNAITQADNQVEVLDLVELPEDTLEYLRECSDQVEVIICWIQTLIIQNMRKAVLDVPPPVLSRVFQELSRGVVNMKNVQKISVFLFPFPYAQLIGGLLLIFTILTPVVTGLFMESYMNAFLTTFTSVFSLVALNFVATEIECPFGTDPNDLPMQTMQQYMNRTLELLLEEKAFTVPDVVFLRPAPKLSILPEQLEVQQEPVPFQRHTSPSQGSEISGRTQSSHKSRLSAQLSDSKRTGRPAVDFAPKQKNKALSRTGTKETSGSKSDGRVGLTPVQEHEALAPAPTNTDETDLVPVVQRSPPRTPKVIFMNSSMGLEQHGIDMSSSNGQEHYGAAMFAEVNMSTSAYAGLEPQRMSLPFNESFVAFPKESAAIGRNDGLPDAPAD